MASLTIWSNVHCPPEVHGLLEREAAAHRILWAEQRHASNLVDGRADPKLAEADIAFGQPDVQSVIDSPRLRWVHLTTAGYTRFDTPAFHTAARARGLVLTNSSSVYAEPCAQHAAAFIYAHARRLFDAARSQFTARDWSSLALRDNCLLLGGQRVLIYGFGAIARRLVELLAPLNLDIIGVRRSPRGDEPVKCINTGQADQLLGEADVIVNLLPANPASERFFDASRLERVKPGALFLNIGRGTTVDQEALQHALATGPLAAAYLDVTDPEPLPPDHALWTLPNCFITPHSAGGFAGEQLVIVRHFLSNLRRFENGEDLADRVL